MIVTLETHRKTLWYGLAHTVFNIINNNENIAFDILVRITVHKKNYPNGENYFLTFRKHP